MLTILARNWWIFLVRGIAAVVFALMAFLFPSLTLEVLVWLVGAYVVVDGIFTILNGLASRSINDRWWVDLLEGVLTIFLGVVMFLFTPATLLVFIYFVSAWAIVTGILEIVAAIRLREVIEGALIVGGVISIVLGVLIFFFPNAGLVSVAWIIGAYALVFGFLMIMLAFRLRRIGAVLG